MKVRHRAHSDQQRARPESRKWSWRFDRDLVGLENHGSSSDRMPFEGREPLAGGGRADSDVTGHVRSIEELRCVQAGPQESLEVPQTADVQLAPQIPLQIGRHVGLEKTTSANFQLFIKFWEAVASPVPRSFQDVHAEFRHSSGHPRKNRVRPASDSANADISLQGWDPVKMKRPLDSRYLSTSRFKYRSSPGAYGTSSTINGAGWRVRKATGSSSACSASLGRSRLT
jgi:hypothetical protein